MGGGGDEGFVLQKREKKISDCLDIVLEKEKKRDPTFYGVFFLLLLMEPDLLAGSGSSRNAVR